ncbi:MAG: DUF2206 domain-containing protein [Methanobacterium sp.]
MLVTIGLNLKGLNIPILSELIVFVYLTFVPGALILRILKVHRISSINTILYSAGLSIISVMFIGLIANMILPSLGISNPISLIPLTVIITPYVILLSLLSYIRDKDYYSASFLDTKDIFSPIFLFICILPFLAIFGTYLMNFYNSNLISIILITLIDFVTFLVAFDKIPRKFYPLLIWIISISLLYDSSLFSSYIWGWDIQNEFFLANMVINNSYWNFNFPDAYNAMLSVVMLSPVYSIFTNMDLIYVFKIIYPLLFSLVPLGLYKIFKSQTNPKIAFLSSFLFVSFYTFFIEMLTLTREMIAELFLILILLVIFTDKIRNSSRILFIIFGLGLVVSHYSLTYFSLFALISAFILLLLFYLFKWFIKANGENHSFKFQKLLNSRINIFIILLITIFMYFWYGMIAAGLALKGLTDALSLIIADISQNIMVLTIKLGIFNFYLMLTGVFLVLVVILFAVLRYRKNKIKVHSNIYEANKFLNPILKLKRKHLIFATISVVILLIFAFLVGKPQTWIVGVLRYLNFAVVFFTIAGLLLSFLHIIKTGFKKEYYALSIIGILVLLTGIFVPAFENSFNITRIFQMTFVFLSPFCIIGGIMVFRSIFKVLNIDISYERPLKVFSMFLILFMLFNAGFFSVLSNQSIPMHLSKDSDYYPSFEVQETLAAAWLHEVSIGSPIFADSYGIFVFYKYFHPTEVNVISKYSENVNSYIFLRKLNQGNRLLVGFEKGSRDRARVYEDKSNIINSKYRIYDNGDAKIYYS